MHFPAVLGPSDPDEEFRRLLRGYALALLLVAGAHAAAWFWTRREPVETPVVIPPMVDVVLMASPRPAPAAKPAPAPLPAAAPPPPKKTETPPKPKPKPKPPPKPAETPRPDKQPAPAKPIQEAVTPVPESAASEAPASKSPSASRDSGPAPAAKAGGGSEQKVTPAHAAGYLHNPKPRYPSIAVARNWEGLVRLRVYVLPDGSPGQVLLHQSSGHDALDEAALDVVHRWRFVPARRGEQAIASWVVVPLAFKLDSAR